MLVSPNEKIIHDNCETAIEYGKSFHKNLDYSETSITDVEEILDYYSKELNPGWIKSFIRTITRRKSTTNQIQSMALIWGVYLGEVIRNHNLDRCNWYVENVFGDGEVLHLQVGSVKAFPIDKVYKRLMNGPEDSILSFYDVIKYNVLEKDSHS
ncbi:hypothetical protein KQI74_02425 [Paenibacillus barcinonensis]|uniref:hypothetical protein n=1 Tax=Paenibacillus barcinonensis TaxID=198119 RepID=UPI001C0F788D|nr:hypothetical protein [Paenibacillus barcinonensis]MBU5351117.1 hypothetical protein [Paenibacillus barcinonensis]